MVTSSLARGLAWFGIGLGLWEALAPAQVARAAGLEGHEGVIQAYGFREIGSGILILSSRAPEERLGVRVAGDLLDGALLGVGLLGDNPKRRNTLLATLAVAPVVAGDVYGWLSARGQRSA